MPDLPPGYRPVSDDDRKKAQRFFTHARSLASSGNYDYAISMFFDGLNQDPDDVGVHRELREISLRRKASGGKGLGWGDALKLKKSTKDDKVNLLNAERLLVYDPGNSDLMLTIAQSAVKIGYYDTALWAALLTADAENDSGKADFKAFLALRDIFKQMQRFDLALQAVSVALRLKPTDMDLQGELRSLGAQQTMKGAGYDKQGSFRDQIKDLDSQLRLLDGDKEINDQDGMTRAIVQAEKELAANPEEPGKVRRLAEALARTEKRENEDRATALLDEWFQKTRQFAFRKTSGEIRMKQMHRQERELKLKTTDELESRRKLEDFRRKLWEFELSEYTEWFKAYPTELAFRFEMGKREMALKKFEEAISSFQQARNDPRNKTEAQTLLGQAFFQANFLDEADETFAGLIRDFPNRESPRYLAMCYWRGRTLELKGQFDEARRLYSSIFQVDSAYRDVADRIKKLRDGGSSSQGGSAQGGGSQPDASSSQT